MSPDKVHYKKWSDVPMNLVSRSALRKQKLVPGEARATVYQLFNHKTIELFDVLEAKPRKEPSSAQIQAIQKARKALDNSRTCSNCGKLYSNRLNGGICEYCKQEQWVQVVQESARIQFKDWFDNKQDYIVIDAETTGLLEDNAEIIQISLVSLDEEVFFTSYVKPKQEISPDAYLIHGITMDQLENVPTWIEVWPVIQKIIQDKVLLAYNVAFDIGAIYNTCFIHGIEHAASFKSHCVMETYAQLIGNYNPHYLDFTWVSLDTAAGHYKLASNVRHDSLADSLLLIRLIKEIATSAC